MGNNVLNFMWNSSDLFDIDSSAKPKAKKGDSKSRRFLWRERPEDKPAFAEIQLNEWGQMRMALT